MKLTFGFIGKDEIELAKQALIKSYRFDDGTWMQKNMWFEKPHTGNYIKGYAYDDVEEVLEHETEKVLDIFHDMTQVKTYIEEFEYSFSDNDMKTFENIFNENDATAYMIDGEINSDKVTLCWDNIKDGQELWIGTVEDAYNELNEWVEWDNMNNHIELIVLGALK